MIRNLLTSYSPVDLTTTMPTLVDTISGSYNDTLSHTIDLTQSGLIYGDLIFIALTVDANRTNWNSINNYETICSAFTNVTNIGNECFTSAKVYRGETPVYTIFPNSSTNNYTTYLVYIFRNCGTPYVYDNTGACSLSGPTYSPLTLGSSFKKFQKSLMLDIYQIRDGNFSYKQVTVTPNNGVESNISENGTSSSASGTYGYIFSDINNSDPTKQLTTFNKVISLNDTHTRFIFPPKLPNGENITAPTITTGIALTNNVAVNYQLIKDIKVSPGNGTDDYNLRLYSSTIEISVNNSAFSTGTKNIKPADTIAIRYPSIPTNDTTVSHNISIINGETSTTYNTKVTTSTYTSVIWSSNYTTYYTVPMGETKISVLCLGMGGSGSPSYLTSGGGGALAYTNNIPVTEGETLTLSFSSAAGSQVLVKRGTTVLVAASCYMTAATDTVAGTGGSRNNSVGSVKYSGGNGVITTTTRIYGRGGSSGSLNAIGANGIISTALALPSGLSFTSTGWSYINAGYGEGEGVNRTGPTTSNPSGAIVILSGGRTFSSNATY